MPAIVFCWCCEHYGRKNNVYWPQTTNSQMILKSTSLLFCAEYTKKPWQILTTLQCGEFGWFAPPRLTTRIWSDLVLRVLVGTQKVRLDKGLHAGVIPRTCGHVTTCPNVLSEFRLLLSAPNRTKSLLSLAGGEIHQFHRTIEYAHFSDFLMRNVCACGEICFLRA